MLAKLDASRARLRERMDSYSAGRHASGPSEPGASSGLSEALKRIPGLDIVGDAVGRWWAQHPLRSASLLAVGAANAVVKPLASRHPIALMAGMAVIGALLVFKRPWRLLLTPTLFVGLVPQLLTSFAQQMPLEAWLAALGTRQSVPPAHPPAPATSAQ